MVNNIMDEDYLYLRQQSEIKSQTQEIERLRKQIFSNKQEYELKIKEFFDILLTKEKHIEELEASIEGARSLLEKMWEWPSFIDHDDLLTNAECCLANGKDGE